MIQGLSLGGEYGSSATYLCEMAGRERRGFWSSFQYVTLIGGQLLALALLLVLQATMSARRRWRPGAGASPSRVGAVLAVVVFFIRRRLDRDARAISNVAGSGERGRSRAAATCSATIRARRCWSWR